MIMNKISTIDKFIEIYLAAIAYMRTLWLICYSYFNIS